MQLSAFRDIVRLLIGDDDPQGLHEHEDPAIDAAVRAVFQMGRQPAGYKLDGSRVTPDVASGDDFAVICLRAARLRLGGQEGGYSYKTRALSVSDSGQRNRELMRELERLLHEVEGAPCFATQRDFAAWASDMRGGLVERQARYTPPSGSIPL